MSDLPRFLLFVLLPVLLLMIGVVWWVMRMNTPRDMRWPRRHRRHRRRSERNVSVPPARGVSDNDESRPSERSAPQGDSDP